MGLFSRKTYLLETASLSRPGDRPVNEDSIGIFKEEGRTLFIVCDGLGGHSKGDAASQCVVESFRKSFSEAVAQKRNSGTCLPDAFEKAQSDLLSLQKKERRPNGMKTTAAVLIAEKDQIRIGHVGDSRVYVFSQDSVAVRTLDHSVPQMLVAAGEIKEYEIRHHPDRSRLLRVMGSPWSEPAYEIMKPVSLKKVQAVLMASDGFWELIDENEMCTLLRATSSAEEWLSAMEETVRRNGQNTEMDNYSGIAIRIRK